LRNNVSEVKLTYESNNKNKRKLKVNSSMKIYELMLSMGIKLLDHVIITENGYYSYKDNGRLE